MQSNKGEIKPLIAGIKNKHPELSETETQHSISRVHKHLRNVNKKAYEPEIIAIGPYHHGNNSLKMMEEHKLRYLQLLLERQEKINVETYISAIKELEQKARDCYAEPFHLKPDKFVKMLVLDGCFIIELLRKDSSKDSHCKNDPIFQMQWIRSSLERDLILFENQIPFFILSELFDLIEGPDQHDLLIDRFLSFCPNFGLTAGSRNRQPSRINHLLDLVYDSYLSSTYDVSIPVESRKSVRLGRDSVFIPCASKLKDANVKFEKKELDTSVKDDIMQPLLTSVNTLVDVEFKDGIMQMPPLTVEDRTECFFRNLIAYEQYFLNDRRKVITDYATFLNCLLDSSRDVEILSEHGIIDNWLGDDKVVARIFNRLTNLTNTRDDSFCYAGMFETVNDHYKDGWNGALAKLRQDVFYSPWANISFGVGVVLLVLTVAQTVCSILSVV